MLPFEVLRAWGVLHKQRVQTESSADKGGNNKLHFLSAYKPALAFFSSFAIFLATPRGTWDRIRAPIPTTFEIFTLTSSMSQVRN